MFENALVVFFILLVVLLIATAAMSLKIIPQNFAGIVERLGKYRTTLTPGPHLIVPFIDRVKYRVDQREQVVSFPPQGVITEDNLTVEIDTVILYTVNNPVAATYEIVNYIEGIHQLTTTTLRNIIGGMTLEHALTSRDQINRSLGAELDAATGRWGIKVSRVELKSIDPPPTIIDAMEKQMRAERDKRAAILTAEGERQSAILSAEGQKQAAILTAEGQKTAAILNAEGEKTAAILTAQGEGRAIETVFQAIHDGNPDQKLLSYQYLQTLPKIAQGHNASTWIIPAEVTAALSSIGNVVGSIPVDGGGSHKRVDLDEPVDTETSAEPEGTSSAVEEAIRAAKQAESPVSTKDEPPTDQPPA
ncbi:SPFH domain-containing protein [Aeromicrobium duanguangcaii]|uniref:SPFH/Band 7/PHB domain protein n=1 Tax=Aeromicrobium duanguangcaii TaxID=2968086 RepID=A0ABY5KBU5_9ACTN|nr:SPFH domain-containing protein [Aeromicrobium duanguangcaii]MCL3837252.1 SPFH/Band 7/PHB domain protein [Aeromicrobium duanguangcaii]UUI67284.1 SPFH/Band 7/PHB domain protein [Aeromicrobium duanguangcaii]